MATTTAKNRKDVDNMTAEERAWDSLNYSYGKKRESSDKSYNKAISQQDRTMQRRGMGRSSYGMQTLAGLQNEKNKAANDIYSEQIADYENRRYQIDRDKVADDQWERTFGENQRQFNENLKENQRQFDTKNVQWWNEFNENARQFNENLAENKRQFDTSEANKVTMWSNEFNETKQQNDIKNAQWWNEYNYKQSRDAVSDSQWERSFNAQNDQWKQQFEYNKMSDDQKLAYNYVTAIIGQGGTPSDELLARAGLSRADANAMTAQVAAGGGGGGGGGNPGTTTQPTTINPSEVATTAAMYTAGNVAGTVAGTSAGTTKKPTSSAGSTKYNSGQYSAYQAQTNSKPVSTTMNSGQYAAYQAQQNAKKKK